MEKTSKQAVACVIFSFFVMGFCDIVGISSDYAQKAFGWSDTTTGLVPAMVFVWFLFFSVPAGIRMNRWGRKNTVLIGMAVTIVGTLVPLLRGSWACLAGYALIGIGNAILQVSQNALVGHVVRNERLLSSSLTAGQFVKAISSFSGPFIMLFAVNVLGGGNTDNLVSGFSLPRSHHPAVRTLAAAHPHRAGRTTGDDRDGGFDLRPAAQPYDAPAFSGHFLRRRH